MYDGRIRAELAHCLADAFLAGVWDEQELLRRADVVLDRRPEWIRRLAAAVLTAYHRPPADRPRELARFIDRTLSADPSLEDEP